MKKLFTLMMVVAFGATLSAQTPRMAFIEEATQASCPPCASLNPALQDMVNANSESVVFMAYQVWWPGFDQMYLDNMSEVDVRVGEYYVFGFAPQIVMQGSFVEGEAGSDPGALGNLTQGHIDAITSEMSEFALEVSATFEDGVLNVSGNVTAEMAASGNLKLHLMLTEGTIYSNQATGGTNGETEYHHVFKKALPGVEGITLATDWAVGDSYTIDEDYTLSDLTIYNYGDLEVIAFIQNDDDKFVHQAAKDGDVEVIVSASNNGGAAGVGGLPGAVCEGTNTVTPEVTIQNTGNQDLTSLDITYDVNGGTAQMFTWTGEAISTLATEVVTLPAITFDAVGGDVINVEVSNPNGMADEDASDNLISVDLALAPSTVQTVTLEFTTDGYGDEVYWELQNSAGGTVASGGNPNVGLENVGTGTFPPPASGDSYGNNEAVTEVIELENGSDCYKFYMADYFGDGLIGGGFTLSTADGVEMYSDFEYTDITEKTFGGSAVVGLEENMYVTGFTVGPNPTNDILNVRFDIASNAATSVSVMNAIGQTVMTQNFGSLQGQYTEQFDMSELENGMYYVTIVSGGETATAKVVLSK